MKKFETIKTGVLLMKGEKAWRGISGPRYDTAEDAWADPTKVKLSDPEYCKKPSDLVTPSDRYYEKDMNEGRLVRVRKTVTVEILE